MQQVLPVVAPSGSRSTCSSDDSHLTGSMEHSAAAVREVTSPCRDTFPCPAPADSPARRVRFSETADCLPTALPCTTPAQAQLQQPASAQQEQHTTSKRKQHEEAFRQLRHTRSYCSGRFMIQEAVAVQTSMLHRSTSAPECAVAAAGGMSSSLSSCSSMQSLQGPFAAVQDSISPSNSESCFAQADMVTCRDLLAANQLMSSFLQLPQHQHAQLAAAAPALGCQPAGGFAVPGHAASGGLFATKSVPMPVLGTASSEEESSLAGFCMSYCDCIVPEAAAPAGPSSFCCAAAVSSSKRRGNCSSNNLLLGGCYSADVQHVAAAAVGHHQQHQHLAPKRSPSMTYFRRGRFLVQTTMG